MAKSRLICGDALTEMKKMENDSVDLIFFSPPYEDCRTYGIDFNLKGQEYVDWLLPIFKEGIRICKGLIGCVIQGRTRKFKWSCTPALLIADLHHTGFNVRNPPIYSRVGIPGSGGPDWLRSDYEWVVCVSSKGRLAWSDNTACGHEPRWPVGGNMSNRTKNGSRITKPRGKNGKRLEQGYKPPQIVNPGNIVHCNAGGGMMGSKLAHLNEAPFPLKLAEFFVKSFCKSGGIVLDPFCGSSSTGAAAIMNKRRYIGIDCRKSQIDLSKRRLKEVRR
jgi:hypothetical protein